MTMRKSREGVIKPIQETVILRILDKVKERTRTIIVNSVFIEVYGRLYVINKYGGAVNAIHRLIRFRAH